MHRERDIDVCVYNICVYISMYIYIYICIYIHVYTYIRIYVYIYIYIYIHRALINLVFTNLACPLLINSAWISRT